ncbi:MAG: GTPase [Candidatus Bathyarchaeota archaeon]|nr:MAG: GTPase [Candidatus Bathyarchaeota archaeon]
MRKKVIIKGAAGRDFHNFNVYFRNNRNYEVVAFTASQIPGIQCRIYPQELAGTDYPIGIPIYPEEELPQLIKEFDVDQVVFAYSDVSHEYVMHKASLVLANGADFCLMGSKATMLNAKVPVVAVCAVRTGSGKSQTSRLIAKILKDKGLKVVVVRHPMPYGDLKKQILQRFASRQDLDKCECTIEEREEYEPHIDSGIVVYAGVDYGKILEEAQKEAEIIIWDGGNNDLPFLKPDLHIVVADPRRAGHELTYYPSEVNLRLANVVIVNKVDTSDSAKIIQVKENVKSVNPNAVILDAASPITADKPELIKGRRVLVIEDGPSVTHGNMPYGAAMIAAKKFGAKELVNPKPYAVGSIRATYAQYPHLGSILPAVGYGEKQIAELEETINTTPCDIVLIGTPIDLRRVIKVNKPTVRVKYELQVIGPVCLEEILDDFLKDALKSG